MSLRPEHALIVDRVPEGARVLDVGCADGTLLRALSERKSIRGSGLELDGRDVAAAIASGLSVIQGDADRDLADYPDDAFDAVILSDSIQAMRDPKAALRHVLRIGKIGIVSFPNFGHWRVRLALGLGGRMPKTAELPARWHETQNIHLCTTLDFADLCEEVGADIAYAAAFGRRTWEFRPRGVAARWACAAASSALFEVRPRRR
ncbi:MAG: methionine biosynthesis protein MetW [Pseudomonadota bacterium]